MRERAPFAASAGSVIRRLCVFCGSNPGHAPAYRALAAGLGQTLARRRIVLVYGGGRVGLMGALADAALEAGAEVIGVIPQALLDREIGHRGLTELADGFVALPGGIGTLEELFEVWTWAQLGLHAKPCGLLDVDRFFAPLVDFLDHLVTTGFVSAAHRAMLVTAGSPDELLSGFASYQAPKVGKWVKPSQT
jgi:uncharacterized protein (TIGR00730 family)